MATLHADSNDGAESLSSNINTTTARVQRQNTTNTNTIEHESGIVCEHLEFPKQAAYDPAYRPVYELAQTPLLQLLSNSLILSHTVPYLSVSDTLRLAATNKDFRSLLYGTPSLFRYLDLSRLHSAVRLGDDFGAALPEPIDRGGQTWRNEQIDENLTEDEFYSGPLRGAFRSLSRPGIHTFTTPTPTGWLKGVHTLILNNVSVTAELVHEILRSPDYNVRILSLRNAKHCNEVQLRHILRTACRASRPDGTPKLRGLYIFGGGASETGWTNALSGYSPTHRMTYADYPNGDELWYRSRGRVLGRSVALASAEWAGTLMDCRGVIAFDGVLCTGPRHTNSPAFGKVQGLTKTNAANGIRPSSMVAMASFSLHGCAGCGSAPEGWTAWGDPSLRQDNTRDDGDPYLWQFPLLWPPPHRSSNARVAMCPEGESVRPGRFQHGHSHGHTHTHNSSDTPSSCFVARCEWCVRGRLCALCHRWWCEACMPDGQNDVPWTEVPNTAGASSSSSSSTSHSLKTLIDYSCRECGPSCHDCLSKVQRQCKRCRQSYCILHNTGSSLTHGAHLPRTVTSRTHALSSRATINGDTTTSLDNNKLTPLYFYDVNDFCSDI